MTNQEIFELMARFDASTATTLKLSTKDFSLELGKGGPAAPIPAAAPVPASAAAVPPAAAPAPAGKCITAPLVGTFYAASAPDAAPFVQVGDHVKKGQTVCLMEAMKMMNPSGGRGPGVLRRAAAPLPGRVSPCSSAF